MLIPQEAPSGRTRQQGRGPVSLAELRKSLARPSAMSDAHRQRLLELGKRLSRLQALGDEYAGVSMSPGAQAAMACGIAVH